MLDIFEGLNDKQQEAVKQIHGALLVLAPVGTGKTKVIAHRAVVLICRSQCL